MATPAWETQMWEELNSLPAEQQIVVSGQYISLITHQVLTALSNFRGDAAERALAEVDGNAEVLADRIGSRKAVIERLASGARVRRRQKEAFSL